MSESDYGGFSPDSVKAAALSTLGEIYSEYGITFAAGAVDGINIVLDPNVNYARGFSLSGGFSRTLRYGYQRNWAGGLTKENPKVFSGSIYKTFSEAKFHETPSGNIVYRNAAHFGTAIGNIGAHELGHRFGIEGHSASGLMRDNPFSLEPLDF